MPSIKNELFPLYAVTFGILPSIILAVFSLFGIGFFTGISSLIPMGAFLGLGGLLWARIGYRSSQALLVMLLLACGMVVAGGYFFLLCVSFFESPRDSNPGRWVLMLLLLGPLVTGFVDMAAALEIRNGSGNGPSDPSTRK